MERFCIVCALWLGQPNILKYIKDEILSRGDLYSLLCFHYFISRWYRAPSILPITTPPKNYIQEALDDSNTRQQCPEAEMWNKPPIEEDVLVGSSLRRSS